MNTQHRPAIHRVPGIMDRAAVFVGTRVPFQTPPDYLEASDPLGRLLDDFPTVSRELVVAALEQAKDALLARASSSRGRQRRPWCAAGE